jgi:CMP-N,N'-diacetyllegionaminic acid synthase
MTYSTGQSNTTPSSADPMNDALMPMPKVAKPDQQTPVTQSIAVIIPARSGSKRIPNKNIKPLLGKPMLAYTVEAAMESGVAERVIVTTDSGQISMIAVEFGAEIVRRPGDISSDTAPVELALLHALDTLAAKNFYPGYVLVLQPNSPLRSATTIRKFVDAFFAVSDRYDSMISVHENYGDFWVKTETGEMRRLFPDAPRRSQDRQPLYEENSALYITRTSTLIDTKSLLGKNMTAHVIDPIEGISVNYPNDLAWAELQLKIRREGQPKAETRPLIPF